MKSWFGSTHLFVMGVGECWKMDWDVTGVWRKWHSDRGWGAVQEESLQTTVMSPSSSKQEINGFGMRSDEGTLTTHVGGHGIIGIIQGWEQRGPLQETWHDSKAKGTAGGICGWVAAAFPQLLRPHGAHLTGEIPSRSSCASLREAQCRGDVIQADLVMIASTIGADFVRYVALAKHTALTAELLSKEGGESFCFSALLVLLKRYLF